jgi:hypothetical protein
MATACIPQITFGFEPKGKPIVATFDQPHASSDGGAVLLKSLDTQLQLTKHLAGCLVDTRQPGKVQHQALELVRQRVFGLACGYADCNDAARLADDAIHKLPARPRSARGPGPGLAADPVALRERGAMGALARHGARAGRHRDRDPAAAAQGAGDAITIDLDPTDDPTHGQQELTFFNGHYDTACYLPIVATVTFNDEAAQFAVAAVLRPGNAPATRGARGLLRRPAGQAARRLSDGDVSGAAGRGLCPSEAVPVPGAAAGRVRRGDGEQPPAGEARAAADGQGPDAGQGHGQTAHLYGRRGMPRGAGRASGG